MSDSFGDISSPNTSFGQTSPGISSNADLQDFVEKEQQRAQFSAQVIFRMLQYCHTFA
jgi:hypothetical protein